MKIWARPWIETLNEAPDEAIEALDKATDEDLGEALDRNSERGPG